LSDLCRPSTPSSAKAALDGDPGLKGLGMMGYRLPSASALG